MMDIINILGEQEMNREKLLMDLGWKFHLGDIPFSLPDPEVHRQYFIFTRTENARTAGRRDFDDSTWRTVNLPHDYCYEESPVRNVSVEILNLAKGKAWYRRTFKLSEDDKGKRITVLFEGVAISCDVYFNSIFMKHNYTGANSFEVDITDMARFGDDTNVLAVRVDCSDAEAFYPEPSGIYRHVWLIKTAKVAVDLWGVFAKPEFKGQGKWDTEIETTIRNDTSENKEVEVLSRILDADGDTVGEARTKVPVKFREKASFWQNIPVKNPKLWDVDDCNLYTVQTDVYTDGTLVDEVTDTFGYRTIKFDADHGFFLNGKHVKINGFANHQSYIGVGHAASDSMYEFKTRYTKKLGANGLRTSHYPNAPVLYDYCDKYGLLVMNENRLFHSNESTLGELEGFIKRDRNHPSVIMWSLYNEEYLPATPIGKEVFKTLRDVVHKLDPTRPATGATLWGTAVDNVLEYNDIIGINHQNDVMDDIHKRYPDKAIYGSELVSTYPMTKKILQKLRDTEYLVGMYYFVAWNFMFEHRYFPAEKLGFIAMFMEPIDSLGSFTRSGYAFEAWLLKEPVVRIWADSPEGWNRRGHEGEPIKVTVFSNGDTAELFLNGKSLGEKPVGEYDMPVFQVPFTPGELKAVVKKKGKFFAEDTIRTSGAPVGFKLVVENPSLKADDSDVAIVTAYLVDKDGNVVTDARGYRVTFSVNDGAGEIFGVVSTAVSDHSSWKGPTIRCYDGKCQVFIRSSSKPGKMVVSASCEGMKSGSVSITKEKGTIKVLEPMPMHIIVDWQISNFFKKKPDMEQLMFADFTESWAKADISLGGYREIATQPFPRPTDTEIALSGESKEPERPVNGYAVFRAATKVPEIDLKGKIPAIYFESVIGKANVYVRKDGKAVCFGEKTYRMLGRMDTGDLLVPCPGLNAGEDVVVWMLSEVTGADSGIAFPVRWTLI
jgi:beta-galactosidase